MAKKPAAPVGRVIERKRTGEPVKPLTVYVAPDLHRRLKVHAVQTGRDMSEIVSGILERYLAAEE